MSDHLIAEANRHTKALPKMALPTTKPNDRDLAWYIRECQLLQDRNEVLECENARLQMELDALCNAKANHPASALPEDLSTVKSSVLAEDIIKALSDIAWYVRECETLREECETLRAENVELLRKNSEWESERVQFANRAAKLARLQEKENL